MGSTSPQFPIPPPFESQLSLVSPLDDRSETEIIDSLKQYKPVTSEKNIWAFWHSGIKGLPAWCKRNVIDWHRINGSSWTIRVLDSDPSSPNFFLNYVPKTMLPAAILDSTMTGRFVGQHTADFLRSATIYEHGGIFMDVGCILIRRVDRICWDKLADDAQPWTVGAPYMFNPVVANHFVACRKGDPFIRRWHDLMLHLWKGKTESTGTVVGNPLMQFLVEYNIRHSQEPIGKIGWDFNDRVEASEYIGQILAFERVCFLNKEDEEGFNGADYWTKHVLVWDSLSEHWSAEVMTKQLGPHPRIMDLLATRRDTDPESEEYKAAYKMTWHLLTNASLQKFGSAKGLTKTPHMGGLWEMPENMGKDCGEGTFAELLRYGSVHFEQKREEIRYVDAQQPENTLHKGLFEP